MDKTYWTMRFVFLFFDIIGVIGLIMTASLIYFLIVKIRDLTDELIRLENTIRERRGK